MWIDLHASNTFDPSVRVSPLILASPYQKAQSYSLQESNDEWHEQSDGTQVHVFKYIIRGTDSQ